MDYQKRCHQNDLADSPRLKPLVSPHGREGGCILAVLVDRELSGAVDVEICGHAPVTARPMPELALVRTAVFSQFGCLSWPRK